MQKAQQTLNYGITDYTSLSDLGTGFRANHCRRSSYGCIRQQNLAVLVRPKLLHVNEYAHYYVPAIAVKTIAALVRPFSNEQCNIICRA